MFVRIPTHAYQDPLERIWIQCAERIGFKVVRSPEAYASYDGKGHILIATTDQFDPDDNLGQMIFHELCHALVEGDEGERQIDWGLDNTRMGNPWREHACLRTQAWLADQWGLRAFLAPTTDYRVTFWESLRNDPLDSSIESKGRRERSVVAARRALWRFHRPRWNRPLRDALEQTRHLADIVCAINTSTSNELPSLWTLTEPQPQRHPAGYASITPAFEDRTCQTCAWSFEVRGRLRCRHAPLVRLEPAVSACAAFEPQDTLDCLACGACCREAYDSVEVGVRDPVRKVYPQLVIKDGTRYKLKRNEERCSSLTGGKSEDFYYACSIYPDRPKTCRDFTLGSANCLEARSKVGLSL